MSSPHEPLRYAHDEGHTDVCFSTDGEKIITVGADGDIRIWPKEENKDPVHNCIGEWALSVRQKGEHIYVTTSNNDVQILTYPDGERDGVLDRFAAPINHIGIARNTDVIALAAEEMEIKLIDLNRSNKDLTIFTGLAGPCLSVALSPDSKKLSASSGDGKLRIWEVENKTLLKEVDCFPKVNSFANAKLLCRMDFEPMKGETLAYPDKNSVVILSTIDLSQTASLYTEAVSASYSIVQYSPCGKYLAASSTEGDFVIWEVIKKRLHDHSKHSRNIGISGFMWDPLGSGKIVYTDLEGQLGSLTCRLSASKEDRTETNVGMEDGFTENEVNFEGFDFEGDDDDADNENAVSLEKLKKQYMGDSEPELLKLDGASTRSSTPRPRTPEVPLQPPFMPSSTPQHLSPRYLCWNEVGVIRSYKSDVDDDDNANHSIEVEFHDFTFHKNFTVPNFHDFTMASLSKASLVVANSSQIKVVLLNASSKEWILKMEETEEIVLVASSENLVCVALSSYLVRVASTYGTQRAVFSVPGPPVSMAAYKNFLMLAYHAGGVRKGDQCINVKLVKFEGTTLESRDISSALGPSATLLWLGFSDVGTPAMMDSLGILSLYPPSCNTWIPYCDTNKHCKGMSDGFFVTAVFESYQALGGIKCRGSIYPGFLPRPTMCELSLEPPLAEPATEKTLMESNLFTWSTIQVYETQKKFKETALKIFALACKNDLEERATEFLEMISNPQVVALACKYAAKLDKLRLAEKLKVLSEKIASECEDPCNSSSVVDYVPPETSTIKPVNRRLTLSASKYNQRHKISNKSVSTPSVSEPNESGDVPVSTNGLDANTTLESSVNTQESLFHEEEPKNPFLKSLKKPKLAEQNPLSLLDKYAGFNVENEAKEKKKNSENSEKRKQPETPDTEKPKEKQRRLDKFMFNKRN